MPYVVVRVDCLSRIEAKFYIYEIRPEQDYQDIMPYITDWFASSPDSANFNGHYSISIAGVFKIKHVAEKECEKQRIVVNTWRNLYDHKFSKKGLAINPITAFFPNGTIYNYPNKRAFLESMGVPVSYASHLERFIRQGILINSRKYPQLNGIVLKKAE